MAIFSYKARNNSGQLIMGDLTAVSEQEVIIQLRKMQYTPFKIIKGAPIKIKVVPKNFIEMISVGTPKVTIRDMAIFCTNLSSMTSASIPLLGALNMVADQLTNTTLASAVRKVSQLVSDGASLSEAMSVFPNIFSKFFVNMVRAAEATGTIDEVLNKMAVYMEKQETLRQTVKGMMVYPTILIIASVLVVLLIITVVMPQFVTIFTKAGVPLPAPTRFLYNTGIFIRQYWWLIGLGIGLIVVGVKSLIKTANGKKFCDTWFLKLPLFGPLVNKTLIAQFTRTLATMLNSGVPMLQGLTIVQQVLDNHVYSGIVREVYLSTEKGEGLHNALLNRREIPKDVTYMISVGEKAGNIGVMLNKIADFYESKVQSEIKDMMVMIEPLFISILGVVVGGILASIILPMFDMVKTIQR